MRRAGELRHNLTPAERRLWSQLRGEQMRGVRFRRQHAIGNYITDFCAVQEKLIIELDGGQHLDQMEYDDERTAYLEAHGYLVLRVWNKEVANDLDGVLRAISLALAERQIPVDTK